MHSAGDGYRAFVSELVISQQVATLFHNSLKKRKFKEQAVPKLARKTIVEMAGDAVEPTVLNIKRYRKIARTIARQRDQIDAEMKWTALEQELDALISRRCDQGETTLTIGLCHLDDHNPDGFETLELQTLEEWMVFRIEDYLLDKGFKVHTTSDSGERNLGKMSDRFDGDWFLQLDWS